MGEFTQLYLLKKITSNIPQARAPYEFFGVWKPPFFGQSCQRKSVPTGLVILHTRRSTGSLQGEFYGDYVLISK